MRPVEPRDHPRRSTFSWRSTGASATITLNRPERKNPLTFEIVRRADATRSARCADVHDVRAVVLTGAGGNFCSGGDVHEIIGPLVRMKNEGDDRRSLAFTQMTGDLVKAMRACPQPIVAAVDGICAGAGAILAMASDLRLGTRAQQSRVSLRAGRPLRRRHGRVRACCRASSATAARASCSSPAAPCTATKPSGGASTTGSCAPDAAARRRHGAGARARRRADRSRTR